jgi:hypothetical protein
MTFTLSELNMLRSALSNPSVTNIKYARLYTKVVSEIDRRLDKSIRRSVRRIHSRSKV